jgi:hypothetical protein
MKINGVKQKASPFLSTKKNWDEEEDDGFQISPEIK